ncbi:LodA/GoxA family CTQ-dependent oxidase [Micromonospora sp. DT46]|uniref:LodA/GoxA family CTQ-dependent oxidase n=1 Tax=Micromonospora sp. DT46 TaxID=3393435 RepID=UPI003CF185BB
MLVPSDGKRKILMAEEIIRAAVHPAIGVARVGNSDSEYFIGPEMPDPPPREPGFYRDRSGAIKRQAARFRVYGYNAKGQVVKEILPQEGTSLRWSVELANKKAAWYQFRLAMDIPEAEQAKNAELRNADVPRAERDRLEIKPGPREVSGVNVSTGAVFDTGKFMGIPVYLGELHTDEEGRLLVLGGKGAAAPYDKKYETLKSYANNDGWHDDVSDGPVTAKVTIDGREIPVDPAWVIVGPPDYAPGVKSVRTLYDLLFDMHVASGVLPFPEVSFHEHIAPVLRRMTELQWVNHGFATRFGWGGADYFLDDSVMAKLARPDQQYAELRTQIYTALRHIDRDGISPVPWPWIYGDAMSVPPRSVRHHVTLSPAQYRMFRYWAAGRFVPGDPPASGRQFRDVALDLQPETLDRAALDFCLADAFHPGCEVTWPIRHPSMYQGRFRIRHRPSGWQEPFYGPWLTPQTAMAVDGPLYAQAPGDLIRWMAVPWQTDTSECRSGYASQEEMGFTAGFDPYLPTWWPATVPNHVLTEADYRTVMDTHQDIEVRRKAFEQRAVWFRALHGDDEQQHKQMVEVWSKLGIVETRDGPDDGTFPAVMRVESTPLLDLDQVPYTRNLIALHVPETADGAGVSDDEVGYVIEQSPFDSDEVLVGRFDKVSPYRDQR